MSASGQALPPGAFSPDAWNFNDKGNIMKRLVFSLFAVTLLALPICAQVATAEATIPFAFDAGNATLPAGKYVVSSSPAPFSVALVGPDRQTRRLAGWPTGASAETPTLVFHRYGNQYFLSEIRNGGYSRMLRVSLTELELKQNMAAAPRSEVIVLAMR